MTGEESTVGAYRIEAEAQTEEVAEMLRQIIEDELNLTLTAYGRGEREFENDPVRCLDCGELVVVTRDEDVRFADEDPKFECDCSVGVMAAPKPDSWEGGDFL